jgi:glycosyltransferase involved in cell wall biosynthesis
MAATISVIIPVFNSARYLRQSLEHLRRSLFTDYECIVVDDGSTDTSAQVAAEYGATVLHTDRRRGPAYARNLGARAAQGEILFFIDADVCVSAGTLGRVRTNFDQDPHLAAVMGSYDDAPASQDFLSLYKNLMHCYVHHNSRREACTFWSGCGAIRRAIFLEHSGFDESYDRPAIEDIELGYRLSRARQKLLLDPSIAVKHLKKWSFFGLVKTDILDRGVPWTELILRDRVLPNDLNLQLSQRVSTALVFLLIGITAAGAWFTGYKFVLPLLTLLFLLLVQFEVESTWKTQPKAIVATILLVSAIVYLGYRYWARWLIPPVLLSYVLLFVRHRYAFTTERRRRITGIVCGVYLMVVIISVLIYLPRHPLVLCFFLVLAIVVILNSQFYVFLAGRTGRLLALAAIPFHLLFHFYNGLSFMIGLARHLERKLVSAGKVEKKRVAVSQDR